MTNTILTTKINPETRIKPLKNHWLANLSLEFSDTPVGTQLTRTQRKGPLSVQKAFYPEGKDCAHIYLLHPPAGIVSGDELRISVMVKKNAHLLFTTPGAGRFYRARQDLSIGDSKQTQITQFDLAAQATCENFPQETIVYEGADGFNSVDIHLTSSTVYLGWDITCLGLPDSAQPFSQGKYSQLNRLFCDNKLIYHDRIALSPENQLLNSPAGLAGNTVFATFLAYAPAQLTDIAMRKKLVEQLREQISQAEASDKISITEINGLLVIRYLGQHAQQCKRLFIRLWQLLRPQLINKTAIQPRIWHT
ncbi:urease accessory protein UreD [Psychromonas antarctica]|uniref:urease accessory protein UreD n=1 Tax=Psychromonas antarctica TaxID=67573 RepID=UPI001EE94445|nr:urease accessory protein UreD [Psychromonas antarctica]MCG6199656.1 urease accessory protein UreD [Psychromonas antarctica]